MEVLNFTEGFIVDVGIGLGGGRVVHVASVWQDSWVACSNNAVRILGDPFLVFFGAVGGREELLHVGSIRKPRQTVDVGAAAVLPLESHPVIGGS